MQRVLDRRHGCEGAKDKDKKAQHHAQNRAGHDSRQLELPVHGGFLSQSRASSKRFFDRGRPTPFTARSNA